MPQGKRGTMLASRNRLPPLRYACGLISALFANGASVSVASEPPTQIAEVQFNTDMLRGFGGAPVDVSRFSRGHFTAPGDYPVPVLVNDRQVGTHPVGVRHQTGANYPQPCAHAD